MTLKALKIKRALLENKLDKTIDALNEKQAELNRLREYTYNYYYNEMAKIDEEIATLDGRDSGFSHP